MQADMHFYGSYAMARVASLKPQAFLFTGGAGAGLGLLPLPGDDVEPVVEATKTALHAGGVVR